MGERKKRQKTRLTRQPPPVSKNPIKTDVWQLCAGSKSRPNHGGTFSPHSITSMHFFGWDIKNQQFVFQNDYGMFVNHTCLPITRKLAQAFLFRCLDPKFNETFLSVGFPNKDAEEVIRIDDAKLCIRRNKAERMQGSSRYWMPGLSLGVEKKGEPAYYGHLFYEMRINLGKRMSKLTRRQIRRNLQPAHITK